MTSPQYTAIYDTNSRTFIKANAYIGYINQKHIQYTFRKKCILNPIVDISSDVNMQYAICVIKIHSRVFAGNGIIDETEFLQWVARIQALRDDPTTQSSKMMVSDEDDITQDLIAAFRYALLVKDKCI